MRSCSYQCDYVIGTDILFDFDYFAGLCDLLRKFIDKCNTKCIYIGYTHRFSDVEKWFKEEVGKVGLALSLA